MNRKVFTMLFGLLLAVGWTNGASAQKLAKPTRAENLRHSMQMESETNRSPYVLEANGVMSTPQRAPQPASGLGQTANFTTPATDPYQMMYMVKEIYTNPLYPGIQYDEVYQTATPYPTIGHGWGMPSNFDDIVITLSGTYAYVTGIVVSDENDNDLTEWFSNDPLPSDWTSSRTLRSTTYSDGTNNYYASYMNNGGTITIPKSLFSGASTIYVYVFAANGGSGSASISINGASATLSSVWDTYYRSFRSDIDNPPSDNGYTVMLVKVKDDATDFPAYTSTGQGLADSCFSKYESIELLTDGLRVGQGTSNAGTVFAYTGTLNRFFFIGKGKTAQFSALAPFYEMYEEFSPTTVDEGAEIKDFYEKMKQGATYDVVHDCQSVSYREHYFSMSGKDGTTHNRVNSLVLYIPDDRSTSPDSEGYVYRDYDHQPTVGMYMIDLYANVEPSTTPNYYTVTVDWFSNLDTLTHTDNIPQTYKLYEIRYNEETGKNDTTLVYSGMNSSWTVDYPVGDPRYYDLHYYVVGTPVGEGGTTENPTYVNPDFFAKSNTDDVTIPGTRDFLGLQWQRYESDYVILNKEEQVNYYRNWLAPHALSVQGEAGINAGNVGNTGRTLTVYRNDGTKETPIMYLDLIMDNNKAYYRIRYINREANQQVEPGYNENTGELNNK